MGEVWEKTTDRKGSLRSKISQTLQRQKKPRSGQNCEMTLEELSTMFRETQRWEKLLSGFLCYGSLMLRWPREGSIIINAIKQTSGFALCS